MFDLIFSSRKILTIALDRSTIDPSCRKRVADILLIDLATVTFRRVRGLQIHLLMIRVSLV
jgi:hypothetical protein